MLDLLRKTLGAGHPSTLTVQTFLGQDLVRQKKYGEGETVLRECLRLREKTLPDEWCTFCARSLLGKALVGQKQYADAEPLLLAGYESMDRRRPQIPRTADRAPIEGAERLVQLYEAWGRPEQARRWRACLEQEKRAGGVPPGSR
jgi:hypothetical protein